MSKWTPRIGGTGESEPDRKPPLWRRRWFVAIGGLFFVLLIIGALSDPEQQADDRAARSGESAATPTPSPTPDPDEEALAEAAALLASIHRSAPKRWIEA